MVKAIRAPELRRTTHITDKGSPGAAPPTRSLRMDLKSLDMTRGGEQQNQRQGCEIR